MEMVKEVENQPQISPKLMKLQEIVEEEEEGGEDRISALADSLLVEIVSRLDSTKEAIRIGTLSNRWKHLWTLVHTLKFSNIDVNQPWPDFVLFIDKTLTQCRQFKLKKFVVHTSHYCSGSELQLNDWIRYAIRCNVEELNLILRNMEGVDAFVLDQFFFTSSCFTDLRLSWCVIHPFGAISWKNLRSLSISNGKLDEELIENILSGSPQLETLELGDCYGFRRLDITSKSVKNLVFSGYFDPRDTAIFYDIIEINAPDILSLTIREELHLWELLLVNMSSLVEANLHYYKKVMPHPSGITIYEMEEEMLEGFILSLRHVKELNFGDFCSKVLARMVAKGFVITSNMKLPDAFVEQLQQVHLSNTHSHSVIFLDLKPVSDEANSDSRGGDKGFPR